MNEYMSINRILMLTGYFVIGVALFLALTLWMCRNGKRKEAKMDEAKGKVGGVDESGATEQFKGMTSKSASPSMVVLRSLEVKGLKFEELLKTPAELLGRGKHGSVYKVMCEKSRMTLSVKRIKDWGITGPDFKKRMQRLEQLKHPNVLRALAFYSSSLEKLIVYEYQQNGSLLRLVQGIQMGKGFDWNSRLSIAASIAEALAFMHQELKKDGIAHGNFKSSNIIFNQKMEACISEYGLMPTEGQKTSFKANIYGLGVVLLELLTGKTVENNGQELASWVVRVLREEWKVEVIDRALIQEGASEGRIVGLLQVAVKCVNPSPEARPCIHQVATMISSIKEEEDSSIDSSHMTTAHHYVCMS